jgi:hypothetical protein
VVHGEGEGVVGVQPSVLGVAPLLRPPNLDTLGQAAHLFASSVSSGLVYRAAVCYEDEVVHRGAFM